MSSPKFNSVASKPKAKDTSRASKPRKSATKFKSQPKAGVPTLRAKPIKVRKGEKVAVVLLTIQPEGENK